MIKTVRYGYVGNFRVLIFALLIFASFGCTPKFRFSGASSGIESEASVGSEADDDSDTPFAGESDYFEYAENSNQRVSTFEGQYTHAANVLKVSKTNSGNVLGTYGFEGSNTGIPIIERSPAGAWSYRNLNAPYSHLTGYEYPAIGSSTEKLLLFTRFDLSAGIGVKPVLAVPANGNWDQVEYLDLGLSGHSAFPLGVSMLPNGDAVVLISESATSAMGGANSLSVGHFVNGEWIAHDTYNEILDFEYATAKSKVRMNSSGDYGILLSNGGSVVEISGNIYESLPTSDNVLSVSSGDVPSSGGLDLVVLENGDIYYFWVEEDGSGNERVYTANKTAAGVLSLPNDANDIFSFSSSESNNLIVEKDNTGLMVVAWNQGDKLMRAAKPFGGAWNMPDDENDFDVADYVISNSSSANMCMALTQDSTSRAFSAWIGSFENTEGVYSGGNLHGNEMPSLASDSLDGVNGTTRSNVNCGVFSDDASYVMWIRDGAVVVASRDSDGVWTKPSDEEDFLGPKFHNFTIGSIDVNSAGYGVAVWNSFEEGDSRTYFSERINGSWTQVEDFDDFFATGSSEAFVDVQEDGSAVLAFIDHQYASPGVFISTRSSGGVWNHAGDGDSISLGGAPYDLVLATNEYGGAAVIWTEICSTEANQYSVLMAIKPSENENWIFPDDCSDDNIFGAIFGVDKISASMNSDGAIAVTGKLGGAGETFVTYLDADFDIILQPTNAGDAILTSTGTDWIKLNDQGDFLFVSKTTSAIQARRYTLGQGWDSLENLTANLTTSPFIQFLPAIQFDDLGNANVLIGSAYGLYGAAASVGDSWNIPSDNDDSVLEGGFFIHSLKADSLFVPVYSVQDNYQIDLSLTGWINGAVDPIFSIEEMGSDRFLDYAVADDHVYLMIGDLLNGLYIREFTVTEK